MASDKRAWIVCWFMFAATALGYMDRLAVAQSGPLIRAEFRLSQEGFGWVLASFSLPYALSHLVAGYLTDRWDARRAYAGAVVAWSLAAVGTALAPTLALVMSGHALLGLAQAFNWPCATRITARRLPPADRALGTGIFNSGAAVGAILTPLIVPPLASHFGWRTAIAAVGGLGLLWVIPWLLISRRPKGDWSGAASAAPQGPSDPGRCRLSTATRAAFGTVAGIAAIPGLATFWIGMPALWCAVATLILGPLIVAAIRPPSALRRADWAEGLGQLVRSRRFWALVPLAAGVNITWHFLANWVPTYLQEDRGMSYLVGGLLSAFPFLAGGLGNLAGGSATRWLTRRGMEPARARAWTAAGSAALIGCGAAMGAIRSDALVLLLLAVMAFGSTALMAVFLAFNQEVAPGRTGLVVGVLGGLGELFTGGFFPLAGRLRDATGEFGEVFVIVALLPVIGLAALLLGWQREAKGNLTQEAADTRRDAGRPPPAAPYLGRN